MARIDSTISESLRLWLEKKAAREDRSLSQVIARLLEAARRNKR